MSNNLAATNLSIVLSELRSQTDVGKTFPPEQQTFDEQIQQIHEYIDVGEYGVAYEVLVAMLENFPFRLSGVAVIKLVEVALLFRFKSELPEDAKFDSRR
jgi:hypothetical protein